MGSAVRRLRHALGLLFLAAGIAYTISLLLVLVVSQLDQRRPVDAIIVMGAAQYDGRPSPVLRARLDHALTLWYRGLARRLIGPRGRGPGEAGASEASVDWTTEAAVGRKYAVAHGVPDSAILPESEGRTTDQSLRAAAALI